MADAGFSLFREGDKVYLYIATDPGATKVKLSSVGSGLVSNGNSDSAKELGTVNVVNGVAKYEIPASLQDNIYRISAQSIGRGLAANQLDNLSKVKISTLSSPEFVMLQQKEDRINYSVDWKYTVPNAVFAEKYRFQMDESDAQDVANPAYDAAANIIDVIDGKYQVSPDLLKISVDVNLQDNYDPHNVSLVAVGNEKTTEAEAITSAQQNSKSILFISSAPAMEDVQVLEPTGTPTLVFDREAKDGKGDYVLSWPSGEKVQSYEVVTNAVKNGTVIVPQADAPETSITAPNGININADSSLTIANKGTGVDTLSSAIRSSKLYHAAGLEDVELHPYIGELSWTDPTDVSKMPAGYASHYLIRITDDKGTVTYYETTEPSVNILEDIGILDNVNYTIEVINTGDPKLNNTEQVYGEYFDEKDNIVIENIQYNTVTLNTLKYTGDYTPATDITNADTQSINAKLYLYDAALFITPVIEEELTNGTLTKRLPYGNYWFDAEYSETIAEDPELTVDYELARPTEKNGIANSFTVSGEPEVAEDVNVYMARTPLVALDRPSDFSLVTNGTEDKWEFVFNSTTAAYNDGYRLQTGKDFGPATGLAGEDGKIHINLSGLFANGSPKATEADLTTYAAPLSGYADAEWANSITKIKLIQLEQPAISSFDKTEAGTYIIGWNEVANASYYRVTVGEDEFYTKSLECEVEVTDAAVEVKVTAIYDTDNDYENNGIVKEAIFNKDSIRTLEQKDDNADNPYWEATFYVDSIAAAITLTPQAALASGEFQLAETENLLTWTEKSDLNKYLVSIDGGKSQVVDKNEVEVSGACEVNVITKGNYGVDTPEAIASGDTLYTDSAAYTAQVAKSVPSEITYHSDNTLTWTDNSAFGFLNNNNSAEGEAINYTVEFYSNDDLVHTVSVNDVTDNSGCTLTLTKEKANEIFSNNADHRIVVKSANVVNSLILGETDGANKRFDKERYPLYVYDTSSGEYRHAIDTEAPITVKSIDGTEIYTLNGVTKDGKHVYLIPGEEYLVCVGVEGQTFKGTLADGKEVEYNYTEKAIVAGTTAEIGIDPTPIDYIALDTSDSASLDDTVLTVSPVASANNGTVTEELGNITYELYGVTGVNSDPELLVAGALNEAGDAVTYDLSDIDLSSYAYLISKAQTDVTNSFASETIITLEQLAAPSGLRIERSAATGKTTAYWNNVANASGYTLNGEFVENTYAEITGTSAVVIAKGNADGTAVQANAIGTINFYFDSEAAELTSELTATIKVRAVDSVSKKAIEGTLRVVNTDSDETVEIYDNVALPSGGMYMFLPDGNYRAAFKPAAEYNGLYAIDGNSGRSYIVEFTVANGVISTIPAEVIFEAVPVVQQMPVHIGIFLNGQPLAGAEVAIEQTEVKVPGKDFAIFNEGQSFTYTTSDARKNLAMPEGGYEATVTMDGETLAVHEFDVTADGSGIVDINIFQNNIPITVIDAVTEEPIDDAVPVVFTGDVHTKEVTVADANSKVLLYDDVYDITVEEGEYNGVDYSAYTGTIEVSQTYPASIVIALAPKDATILDTPERAVITKVIGGANDGQYEIRFSDVTTFNGGQDFKTAYPNASIDFKLYGLDENGETQTELSEPTNTKDGYKVYYVDEATYNTYAANGFAQVATIVDDANEVPNPVGSQGIIRETRLATPEFNELSWNAAAKEYSLSWNPVENAETYTYKVNDAEPITGYTETSLIVNGDETINVTAVPAQAATFGKVLTSENGEFNYYISSDAATTTVAVEAYVPILVKDGYTGQTVAASVTLDKAAEPTIIEWGGTAVLLPVGSNHTVAVKKDDVNGLSDIAYAEDEVTQEFTVGQYNLPIVLTFTPAEAQQLPKPTSLRFNFEEDPITVRVAFSKVAVEDDPDAELAYSLVGVKANGLEEVINSEPTINQTNVIFNNVDYQSSDFVNYKVVTSATGGKVNYIASEVSFTFAQLAAPEFGPLYRDDETKDLMLPWSPVDNATGYIFAENDEAATELAADVTSQVVTAGNTYTVQALGNKAMNVKTTGNVVFYLDSSATAITADQVTDPTEVTFGAQDKFENPVTAASVSIVDAEGNTDVLDFNLGAATAYLEDGTYTATLNTPAVPINSSVLYKQTALQFTGPYSQEFTVKGGIVGAESNNITFDLDYNLDISKTVIRIMNGSESVGGFITFQYDDMGTGVTNTKLPVSVDGTTYYLLKGTEYDITITDSEGNNLHYSPVKFVPEADKEQLDLDITETLMYIEAIDGYTGKEVDAYPVVTAAAHEDGTAYTDDEIIVLNLALKEDLQAFKPGTYSFSIESDQLTKDVIYKPLAYEDITLDRGLFYPMSVIFVPEDKEQLASSSWVKYNGENLLTFAKVENAVEYQLVGYKNDGTDNYVATKKDVPEFKIGDISQYTHFQLFARSENPKTLIDSVTVVTYEQLATPDVQKPYFNTEAKPIISWGAVANAFGYTVNDAALANTQTYYEVENGQDYSVTAVGNVVPDQEVAPIVETNRIALYGDSETAEVPVKIEVPVTVNVVDGATGEQLPAAALEGAVTAEVSGVFKNGSQALPLPGKLAWGQEYDIKFTFTENVKNALAAEAYEDVETFQYTAKFSDSAINITLQPKGYGVVSSSPSATIAAGGNDSIDITFTAPKIDGADIPTGVAMTYQLCTIETDAYGNSTMSVLSGPSDSLTQNVTKDQLDRLKAAPTDLYLMAAAKKEGSNYTVSVTKLTLNFLTAPVFNGVERDKDGNLVLSWQPVTGATGYSVAKGEAEATNLDKPQTKVEAGAAYTVTAKGTTTGENTNGKGINIYMDSPAANITIDNYPMARLEVIAIDGNNLKQVAADVEATLSDGGGNADISNLPDGVYTVTITGKGLTENMAYVDNGVITKENVAVTNGRVDTIFVTFLPQEATFLGTSLDAIMYPHDGLAVRSVENATDAANYTLYGYKASADNTKYDETKLGTAGALFSENKYVMFQGNPNQTDTYFSAYDKVKDYDYLAVVTKKDNSVDGNYKSSITIVNYKTLATPQLNPIYRDEQSGDLVLTWGAVPNAVKYAVYEGEATTPKIVEDTSCTVENGKAYTVQAVGNITPDTGKRPADIVVKADPATGAITFYADSQKSASTGKINVTSSVVFSANVAGKVTVTKAGLKAKAATEGIVVELRKNDSDNTFSSSAEFTDGDYEAIFTAAESTDVTLDLNGGTAKYTAPNANFTITNGVLQDKKSVNFQASYAPDFTAVTINLAADVPTGQGFGLVITIAKKDGNTQYKAGDTPNDAKFLLNSAELTANIKTGATYYIYALDKEGYVIPTSEISKTYNAGTAKDVVEVDIAQAEPVQGESPSVVDGKVYNDINEAVDAALETENPEVTLMSDATLTEPLAIEPADPTKTVTLDLNGKELKDTVQNSGNQVANNSTGVVTVSQGKVEITGTGTITSATRGITIQPAETQVAARANNTNSTTPLAEVTIDEGVTVESTGAFGANGTYDYNVPGECAICIMPPGNDSSMNPKVIVNIKGTVKNNSVYAAVSGNGLNDGTEINVYPGAEIISENSIGIYHPQAGTLNIYGGTIVGKGEVSGESGAGIAIKAGTLNVYGGTIRSEGSYVAPAQLYTNNGNPGNGGVAAEGSGIFISSEGSKYVTNGSNDIKVNIGTTPVPNNVTVDNDINITSVNGHAIREVLMDMNGNSDGGVTDCLSSINIQNGSLSGAQGKDTVVFYGLSSSSSPELPDQNCTDGMKSRNTSKITLSDAVKNALGETLINKYFTATTTTP